MATETSPLNRQPDKLDYSSPTQFRFMINQLPKVQFFTQSANIPAISLGELVIPTPYKDIPIIGDVAHVLEDILNVWKSRGRKTNAVGVEKWRAQIDDWKKVCLLYTSPSPRD